MVDILILQRYCNWTNPPYYTDSWDILTTGFKAVGIWTSSQDYTQGDVVQYGGYSYVAFRLV